ncbi:MAG: lipase [Candidatus Latescibacteria bacterium]|nr:lipase [Candidatus Latescibacterota bacterium]
MEDIRINFIGDSFANGTGDSQFQGWPGRLCAQARLQGSPVTCYNLGIRADTSTDVLNRWEHEVDARRLKPHDTRIVFQFGANDCWMEEGKTRVAHDTTVANSHAILAKASGLYPTLLIGPPPALDAQEDVRRQSMCDLLSDIAAQEGVPYLSVIDALRTGKTWQTEQEAGDLIHPSTGGYQALSVLVSGWSSWWFQAHI